MATEIANTPAAMPQAAAAAGDVPTPASSRQYLRNGLPGVYREGPSRDEEEPFAMRFVGALEGVLDPAVAMIELLPAHLDLALAPPDVVAMVGAWLGLEFDRTTPLENRRALTDAATEVTRARGTLTGIRRVLAIVFPDLTGVTVHDSGSVTHGPPASAPTEPLDPVLVVSCPATVPDHLRDAIRRVVEELKPVHVRLELVLPRTKVTA
jgi:phage tail-like protein